MYAALGVTLYLLVSGPSRPSLRCLGVQIGVVNSRKRQPVPIPPRSLLREILIQQPLIGSIEAPIPSGLLVPRQVYPLFPFTSLQQRLQPIPVRLFRTDHHYTRVEAVRPAGIGTSGQGVRVRRLEEVSEGSEREDVCVEVDQRGEERVKPEEVELSQSKVEVRASCRSASPTDA